MSKRQKMANLVLLTKNGKFGTTYIFFNVSLINYYKYMQLNIYCLKMFKSLQAIFEKLNFFIVVAFDRPLCRPCPSILCVLIDRVPTIRH